MHFITALTTITGLAAVASAGICPGFNYGISEPINMNPNEFQFTDDQTLRYEVYNTAPDCRVAYSTVQYPHSPSSAICHDSHLRCSPGPNVRNSELMDPENTNPGQIHFTNYIDQNGNNYACRSDPNSGSCYGHKVVACCRNDGRKRGEPGAINSNSTQAELQAFLEGKEDVKEIDGKVALPFKG
ncbi:hypothetical protein BT63DRAFT_451535 [Microthyrium microscopicum]|uniref:Uncharacterized protein n=1 Tax=Microthyrium microscopicum TaxID=703497 RepID=A0A6A6UMI4_9PEZI|nr:hypothetical protein BT63DRAFT_451535 [Microthyrium microscopicum]